MGAVSQELTERAKLLISERKYQEAVRACRRALLSRPDQVEVRLLLGEALLALERYDEVRVEMMALARKLPQRGDVHRLLGEAYLRDRRPAQAVEALTRALELDPNDAAARELLIEADDETAPISSTIERWFSDEATPTIETESPAWEEEKTPVPATGGMPSGPPSVEIDPSLTGAGPLPGQQTKVQGPRVRSRKPTLAGQPSAFGNPLPPPSLPTPYAAPSRPIAPSAPPPSAPPPPSIASSAPPPPRMPVGPFPTASQPMAGQPMAGQPAFGGPSTDELELDSLDAQPLLDDFEPLDEVPDELSGIETRAHVPAPSFDDDEPETGVRPPSVMAAAREMNPSFAPRPVGGEAAVQAPRPVMAPARPAPAPAPSPARAGEGGTARIRLRQLRRWVLPAAIGGGVLLLLIVGVSVGIAAWLNASAREDIREAAQLAGDSGLRADLETALAKLRDEGSDDIALIALEARLKATLVLEHDEDRAATEVLLSRVGADLPADARIAQANLDLDRGDATSALQRLSGLTAEGEQIAEAFRARALATGALGRMDEAKESARQAATLRPSSPRHVVLYALVQHQAGDSASALTLLDALPNAGAVPIRVARARIASATDLSRAHAEASAVLGELREAASPHELAWAHLIGARYAAAQGDDSAAIEQARAAAEHTPPLDEAFGVQLVETLLRAGAPTDARTQLARLPAQPVDPAARALLTAEVALENGELDAADAALGTATEGPRRSLLRGRVLEARGKADEARPLYEQAMQAPGAEGKRARIRLASIALDANQASRAVALLEPSRSEAADDLELTSLLTRAYLAAERLDDAQRVLDAAIARRPDSAELLATRGALELRRGRFTEALATLRQAAQARPGDADLQARLGDAARLAGETDAARTAFEAGLALRANHPGALLGLARLALEAGDFEQAEQRVEAAAGSAPALEVARVRGELFVQRGDGALGVNALERSARRVDDPEVWSALGQLQVQAEDDRAAARTLRRARRRGRHAPVADLASSVIDLRRGSLGDARRAIADAAEHGAALGPQFQASLTVARGRLAFENGDFDAAVRMANDALGLDARNAAAHLLLANVAIERNQSPVEHLRRAAAGRAPAPEAVGRLAARLPQGEEACRLASRYLQVAPRGYDASDVRAVARGCR